jgi:glucokinase
VRHQLHYRTRSDPEPLVSVGLRVGFGLKSWLLVGRRAAFRNPNVARPCHLLAGRAHTLDKTTCSSLQSPGHLARLRTAERVRARLWHERRSTISNEPRSATGLFLGIDLGGTKILAGIADEEGRILSREYRETRASEGPEAVFQRLFDITSKLLTGREIDRSSVRAVGVAAPGPIDARSGVVTAPPNLPGWHNVPLASLIHDEFDLPAYLENDANAAALGEHRFGSGRGCRHMVYVTVSTGIGGGFIFDGKLYTGATGGAAEVGHMTIVPEGPLCSCGNRGCLEVLASGSAIAREARRYVQRGLPTRVAELADGDLERITAKLVAEAAERGDEVAKAILDQAMRYLGIGLANLANLLNPELLVIGGGLSKMGNRLFTPVRRAIDLRAFPNAAEALELRRAKLGDDVGLLGAAAVAMSRRS